ncbi:MAG: succinate dehydrogenase cytochrome b subunit [Bacteroidota bacterium]|nr:succinate dehydrogenase cytochrome b subunit [Candidatus Kapabacteria bacterium]MDW8219537.1 succinate dehydrogenase cytochrome b subunit [Bacteroidota bacterium]
MYQPCEVAAKSVILFERLDASSIPFLSEPNNSKEALVSVLQSLLKYSVGKKQVMGVLGLLLCGFAFVHMTGNFLVFQGAEKFNAYGEFLHNLPAFRLIELTLAGLFLAHIVLGIVLAVQNRAARPERYAVQRSAGGATIGSKTMAFTGIYFIVFLIVHLLNIRFHILPTPAQGATEYDITAGVLASPGYAAFYIISACILGLHLSHGLSSAFQSLGWYNSQVRPILRRVSIVYGIVIAVGYSAIALFLLIKHG